MLIVKVHTHLLPIPTYKTSILIEERFSITRCENVCCVVTTRKTFASHEPFQTSKYDALWILGELPLSGVCWTICVTQANCFLLKQAIWAIKTYLAWNNSDTLLIATVLNRVDCSGLIIATDSQLAPLHSKSNYSIKYFTSFSDCATRYFTSETVPSLPTYCPTLMYFGSVHPQTLWDVLVRVHRGTMCK